MVALYDTATHIAIEALGTGIVQAQTAAEFIARLHARYVEGRMAAYLEEELAAVGVLNMPHHVQHIVVQSVSDA